MKILVGCETSGLVRDAFIKRGHDAISCDILPTDTPGPHHQGEIHEMLNRRWDMIIMFPECTRLCVSGNRWYGVGKPKHPERIQAITWTVRLWAICNKAAPQVCFENPVGVLSTMGGMPRPHYVQPWMFGHMEQKKTGLILANLPPLQETNNVYDKMMKLPKNKRERVFYLPPTDDRWKLRSKTYPGIADAMGMQWG